MAAERDGSVAYGSSAGLPGRSIPVRVEPLTLPDDVPQEAPAEPVETPSPPEREPEEVPA